MNQSVQVKSQDLIRELCLANISFLQQTSASEKLRTMSNLSTAVSLHPYFQIKAGELESFCAIMPEFVERTKTEEACVFYDFFLNDHTAYCREAYIGADGILAHLENVGELIERFLNHSELIRLEVHGPAAEIDKLRAPMADLNPAFFAHQMGLDK